MNLNPASRDRLAFTIKKPIGTVVAVSAFNHPFNLIIHQVIPAVATGCPCIVKPAATTPLSCYRIVNALHRAGLPEPWCQVLMLEREQAEQLVTDDRVRFFSFIGSAKVGWYLRSKLASGVRCALEHGGAAPVIIEPDADLERIVPLLVKGGYYHAGQVCVSVQRIFAHRHIADDLTDRMQALVERLQVGDPLDRKTEVGPLITPAENDRVAQWVKEAVDEGGTLVCGGKKLFDSCYLPTLLRNPSGNSKVSRQEIFGPVVTVSDYDDYTQAILMANDVPFSFQASVCTRDIDRALAIAGKINASAVMINDHSAFRVDWMPFAGHRVSGYGIGGIPYTMADMSEDKMLVIRSPGWHW